MLLNETLLTELSAFLEKPVSVAELSPLPFYDHGSLLTVDGVDYIAGGNCRFEDATIFDLDGTHTVFAEINEVAGLRITADTVMDYCKFYVGHIRGKSGEVFTIREDMEHQLEGRKDDNFYVTGH